MKEEYFGSTKSFYLDTNFFDKMYNICYDFKTGGNEIAFELTMTAKL